MFGKLTICDSSGRNLTNPYIITQQFTYVGKNKDCDIRFENQNCAGKQFLLTACGNGLVKIQNLSKKYATQVNQKPIGFQVDHDLKEKDTISAAGRTIMWSYEISAVEGLPHHGALKRTRHSEPIRKVAVVTPNRREQIADEEEGLPPTKRRKTLYERSVGTYPTHDCLLVPVHSEQSSFARRVSYDKMLKGRATPSHKGRLSTGTTPRRLAGSLRTPRGSAQKNKKTSFAHSLDSSRLVYNRDTAFNTSITPRTFYASRSSNAPFTFRGFNPVPEDSRSSILPEDRSFLSGTESNSRDRRSGRVSTPLPKKRLTSPFHSARTSRHKSILTGTPNVYFPTIEEGSLMESTGHHKESHRYENTETLASLNDPNYGRDSTPASYFSPTSSGTPRMMRAESPNIQLQNAAPRSPYQGRRSLMTSSGSTSFGTPQELFHQSQQHDSLFVNTSGSSHIRQRRSQGSFIIDQSHYSSHDSILRSPQPLSYNTPSHFNTPRRSRSVTETPGSSSFSPMSYNDTEYVLLSPRGRNLVNKRYGSDHPNSSFSQSPYSPSQNTLDFTASPPQHRFARTPKRSLSMQVLTKSLQKKADYGFSVNNPSSAKARKSQRKSQVKSDVLLLRSSSAQVLTPPALKPSRKSMKECFTPESDSKSASPSSPAHVNTSGKSRKSRNVCSEEILALQTLKPSPRKSSRLSLGEEGVSNRATRRSRSVPTTTPAKSSSARKSRKSGNVCPDEIPTPGALSTIKRSGTFVSDTDSEPSGRKSSRPSHGEEGKTYQASQRSQSAPSDTAIQSSSARKSRKSGDKHPEKISAPNDLQTLNHSNVSGVFLSDSNSKPMTRKPSRHSLSGERISNLASRRSRSVKSGTSTSSPARKSRKSDIEDNLEPNVPISPKRSGSFESSSISKSSRLILTDSTPPSRRSQLGQPNSPDLSNIFHRSRRSGNAGPQEISAITSHQTPKRSGTFMLETDSKPSAKKPFRSSQSEQSILTLTPTQSNSSHKSMKSGMGSVDDNSESTAFITLEPKSESIAILGQSISSSRVLRRSQIGHSGSSTHVNKSKKSGNDDPEIITTPGALQTLERSCTFVLETDSNPSVKKSSRSSIGEDNTSSRVSRRSLSACSPTQSSSACKSRTIGEKTAQESLEPVVPPTPNNASQDKELLSSRVSRRSRSVPAGTPTRSSSARKAKKSAMGSTESSMEPIFPSMLKRLSLSEERISPQVSRRSQGVLSGSATQLSSACSLKKSSVGSTTGVDITEPCVPLSPNRLNSPRKYRGGMGTKKLSDSSSKKNTPTNLTESSIARDIKPVLSANGTITWPVTAISHINTLNVTASSKDVKPIDNVCASRSDKSLESPTASFVQEFHGFSTRLDESVSSIANISAIPKSSRRTRVMFSTPDPSNKKSVKITSTPFPKRLVSGRDGTGELSSDSTLPIEIDTVNIHGNYISSDSPDYDKITDEELFDVTDVPSYRGGAARTSLIKRTPKSSSKSVSFVAIKSGVKNRKSKTPPFRNCTVNEEAKSSDEVTPSNTSLEVNLRSSRKTSMVKKSSPCTPLTAGNSSRAERVRKSDNLNKSLSQDSLVKILTPIKSQVGSAPLASSLNTHTSPGARQNLEENDGKSSGNSLYLNTPMKVQKSLATTRSCERSNSPRTAKQSITPKASGKITPPRILSPEVVLRSSRKTAPRSMQLSVPGTPTSGFKRNPRRSVKKASPSAHILRRKLEAVRSPSSAVKKLKLDPDKPDKNKMAALWVCHKKKSPTKPAVLFEQNVKARRSFDKSSKLPTKFNTSVPRNFKFQNSGSMPSGSLLEESHIDTSGKPLTPIKDLDALPQQLSPEDDLLNALDLSRKSAVVVEPQKPSRRLRSSTQRRTPNASSTMGASASGKPSPSKSTKKLLFRSPLVDYEGSQALGEPPQVNSSNIKSILMPSPTTSSDEPMSSVFTTSPVVDYTDSSGKKKIFLASPTSKVGGIRELIPSEEMDLTGVRDLFEHTTLPSVVITSSALSGKRGRKGMIVDVQDVSSPKMAKVSPRRKRGAPFELYSDAKRSASVVDESSQFSPPSSKSSVRKLRYGATDESTEDAFPKQKGRHATEPESEINFEIPLLAKRSNRANKKPKPPAESSNKGKAPSPSNSKKVKRVRISVGAAKAVLKIKAVGSKQSKHIKVVESPGKLRSKNAAASKGTSVRVSSSKESPNTVSTIKQNSKKRSAARNVKVVVSPKKLRSKKVVAPKGAVVKAPTSPEKGSTPKQAPKNVAKNMVVVSPEKHRSKKVDTSAVNASNSKKSSAPMNVKDVASPKKLRSKNVAASKGATVEAFTQKESLEKSFTQKKVSTPKKASRLKKASKNVKVVVSPKKLRSNRIEVSKEAIAAPTSKKTPKKISTRKKISTPRKVPTPKRTSETKSTENVEFVESPKKLRAKKIAGSKKATAKASTSKGSPKKISTQKKISTPRKASPPKRTSEKTSTKNVNFVESPKKLRVKKVVASSSKKSPKEQTPKRSDHKSKSDSPTIKHIAAKGNTKKQNNPTLKNTTPKVSPRKTRSVAKPEKDPKQRAVSRRRR